MLKGSLLHPQILTTLGTSGHGSKILIADGNFPFRSKTNPAADKVYLNLSPGVVGAVEVLSALCEAVPVESALAMSPPTAGDFAVERPDIWDDFSRVIQRSNPQVSLNQIGRFNFYDACASNDVTLVIATAEQRIFANLLLTIGVVRTAN